MSRTQARESGPRLGATARRWAQAAGELVAEYRRRVAATAEGPRPAAEPDLPEVELLVGAIATRLAAHAGAAAAAVEAEAARVRSLPRADGVGDRADGVHAAVALILDGVAQRLRRGDAA